VTWNVGLVPAFVDTTALEGESYFYRVAAVNLVGDTWDYSDPNLNEGAQFPTAAMMSPYSIAVFGQAGGTGLLRVQTVPAVPTTIYIDGLPRDDWGLNFVKLPAGNYNLSFSDVHGFASPTVFSVTQAGVGPVVQPVSSPITIVEGEVTEVIVNYSELGNLHIMTSPPVPATLFVDGWPSEDWGLWTYFQPGQYDITFGDLSGYTSPAPTSVTVTAGATTEITGAYGASANEVIQPPHGLFHVQTSPAVRTSITVDGHPSDDWGLTYVKLSPGEYMLDFTDVAGFRTPTQVAVSTNGGGAVMMPLSSPIPIGDTDVLDVVATFEPIGNLWVQTSPPVPATVYCNGEPMDDWGFWTYLDPGVYTVSFETLAGFTTPAPIDVTVTAGATTHVVGDFNTGVSTLVP